MLLDDLPLLGSFTMVGFVFFNSDLRDPRFQPGTYVPKIGKLREKHCPKASLGHGNLALLGIEVPTVWTQPLGTPYRTRGVIADGFWWAAEVLKFTVPYSSTGYQVETERGCEVRPALPEPGAPR